MDTESTIKKSKQPTSHVDELAKYFEQQLSVNDKEVPLAKYLLPADSAEVQRGVETGRYPTLSGLARLQRQAGQPPNPSGDSANSSPPGPFPPRRTKAELLGSRDFAEIDRFASSVTPLPNEDWDQLAGRLFRQAGSNLDRVRLAFCFACTNRQLEKVDGQSAAYEAIRMNESTEIFEKLMLSGGVPIKKIYGYKKGADYDSGLKAEFGGFWFACYVEGEWRFVDAHWGATAVVNHDSGRYGAIDDKGRVASARERSGQSVFHCNEFFFLTDPERLIISHCPPENLLEWQLLARPVSIEEFELMPRYFAGSADESQFYDLQPINYPWNVIVAKPGPVEILFKELAGERIYKYDRNLMLHKKHISDASRKAILSAYQQKACVSKEIRVSKDTVKFIFEPPYPGQYALDIILWRRVSERSLKGSTFVTYAIHCPQNWTSTDVIPEGQESLSEFGPGREMRQAGFTTDAPGELKAADGEASLEVAPLLEDESSSGPARQRKLNCEALGPDNQPLPAGSVLVWQDDARNNFLFLAPDSGYYALVLYENSRPVGQFLVDASSEAKDGGSFPLPDWSRVGGLGLVDHTVGDDGGRRLVPLSHQIPYVRTEEAELALRFGVKGGDEAGDSDGGIELRAELLTVGAGGGAELTGDFTLVSGAEGSGYEVRCRFPRAGHYLLRLSWRKGGGEWRAYYTYFVRAVGLLDGSAVAFPSLGPDWPSRGALVEPLERTLPRGQPITVRLRLGDYPASAVEIVDERSGRRATLNRDPDDPQLWVGSVPMPDDSQAEDAGVGGAEGEADVGGVTVIARNGDGDPMELVKFDFESEGSAQAKAAALREARALNERRQVDEENRQRKQQNRRRREEGLEPLPVKESEKLAEAEAEAVAKAAAEAEAEKAATQAESARKAAAAAQLAAEKSLESEMALGEASNAAGRSDSAGQSAAEAAVAAESAAKSASEAAAAASAAANSAAFEEASAAVKLAEKAASDAEAASKTAGKAVADAEEAAAAAAQAHRRAAAVAEAARKAAEEAAAGAQAAGNDEAKAASVEAAKEADKAEANAKAAMEKSEKAARNVEDAKKQRAKVAASSEAAAKSMKEANESASVAKAAVEANMAAEAEAAAAAKEEVRLLIAQLDEALLSRKIGPLRGAIKAVEAHATELRGVHANKLREAQQTLIALQNRKDLRSALADAQRSRSTELLRALVHRLEAEKEQQALTESQLALFREDLRLAREAIERDDRLRRIPRHRLEMSPKSLSELQRYSRPVETVHRTVQALLLLLGNYEKRTRKWRRCQPLLKNITKTVADFQPRYTDPRIAARSREILDGIDKREIALQSAAAFAFYEWAVKTTDSLKEASTPETFVPASVKQQILILGVTEEEDETLDFDDEGIRRKSRR